MKIKVETVSTQWTDKYSDRGDCHSGAYVAYRAEERGNRVVKEGEHYKIENDNGYVNIPDRNLYPTEYRGIVGLLKAIGVVLFILIVAVVIISVA